MNNQIIINADDYGLTNQISSDILNLLETSELNSTSVLVNGYGDDKNLKNLSYLKENINIKLHLNLIESKSLYFEKKDSIYFLTNDNGVMDNDFFNLSLKKLFLNKKNFLQLKYEIGKEINLQIEKFKDFFNLDYLSIDTHQHTHNIPYIFKIIQDLKPKYKIKNIRITNEKINFSDILKLNTSLINNKSIFKKLLFKILNKINHSYKDINSNYSFGLCESFRPENKLLFKQLNKFLIENFSLIEIFCHPGKALKSEFIKKNIKNNLIDFYTSKERDEEKEFLKSKKLKNFLSNISSLNRR